MSQNRVYQSYYPYFITIKVLDNEQVFREDIFAKILMKNIFLFCYKYRVILYGYCIMPDHVHFLIKTTSIANISRVMGAIKSKTWLDLRRSNLWKIPLWQKRFYHKISYDEETFESILSYIKHNSVKARLERKYHKLPYLYICKTGLKLPAPLAGAKPQQRALCLQ